MIDMLGKILVPLARYKLFPTDKNLYKACSAMFDDKIPDDVLLQIKYVFDYVKLETVFPKYAIKEELRAFTSPTLLIVADEDVFFPANKVVPQSKEIFANLQRVVVLQNASHFQNTRNLKTILEEIESFLQN